MVSQMPSILKVLTEKNRRNIRLYFEIFRPKKLLKDDGRWPPEHLNLKRFGYSFMADDDVMLRVFSIKSSLYYQTDIVTTQAS